MPPPNTRHATGRRRPSTGSDATTCAAAAAIDSTAQRVTAARSVGRPVRRARRRVVAMSAGARKRSSVASTTGTRRRPPPRLGEELVEVGSPHWRRHSSTSHQPATLRRRRTPPSAPSSLVKPGREGRAPSVGLGLLAPDEQPGAGRRRTARRARPPPSTADAVSWPPTRCTGTPRQRPDLRPGRLQDGGEQPTDRTPTASQSSADHVPACEVEQPGGPARRRARRSTTPVRWWTSSSGSIRSASRARELRRGRAPRAGRSC